MNFIDIDKAVGKTKPIKIPRRSFVSANMSCSIMANAKPVVCSPETLRISLGNMMPLEKNIYGSYEQISNRRMRAWVDDYMVNECYSCNAHFSFYNRKHHCRMCGRIFCYNCSNIFRFLPQELIMTKNEVVHAPTIFMNWLNLSDREHRVCRSCNMQVNELEKYRKYAEVLELLRLNLKDYANLICVNKKWAKIGYQYKSKFRELQYYLWDREHNILEKRTLENNAELFPGHRLWIKQLLSSAQCKKDLNQILKKINSESICSCEKLLCSRTCDKRLYLTDIITVYSKLKSKNIDIWKNDILRTILVDIFRIADMEEILTTLLWWVRQIHNDNNIFNLLMIRASKNNKIALYLFWYIIIHAKMHPDKYIYRSLIRKFFASVNSDIQNNIKQGYALGRMLCNIPMKPSVECINTALRSISVTYLPTECDGNPTLLFTSQSRITTSANCPIYIPGVVYDIKMLSKLKEQSSLLYKQEDVRIDCVVMHIIRFMNLILKRNNLDLDIVTYDVVPLSKSSGCIKIVPDSFTLYRVKKELQFTIQNFILENNPSMNILNVRNRFIRSCAGACVVSFMLGLGDRHLENIMITKSGRLFHIDFDFIMGYKAKPFQPEIRITPDMIDAMGGESSVTYREFQSLCTNAYNCLRSYVDVFAVMLKELTYINPKRYPEEYIMQQIIRRFAFGESDNAAQLQFKTVLHKSWSTHTSSRIADFIHRQHKEHLVNIENLKTICQNKVEKVSKFFGFG